MINCDKCNVTFKTISNLNRHKKCSCPYNLTKIIRYDNLNRKKPLQVDSLLSGFPPVNIPISNQPQQDSIPNLTTMMIRIQDTIERIESKLIKPQCINIGKIIL